jgi:hypothetical protein
MSYVHERHNSVATMTNFSLSGKHRVYRENPPIASGNLRAVSFEAATGNLLKNQMRDSELFLEARLEKSSHVMLRSDFDFTQIRTAVRARIPTIYRSHLLKPYLAVSILGGISSDEVPPQRLFSLESKLAEYAPFGVMRAAAVKEFSGDQMFSMHAEHNFRSIPFQALGISTRYEFVLFASTGRTWSVNRATSSFLPTNTAVRWYSEIGFGVGRLLEILRMDFTWRITPPQAYVVSLGTVNPF